MSDRITRGESVNLDALCADHPEFAAELRDLWAAILVTDATGAVREEAPGDSTAPRWRGLKLPAVVGDYELLEEVGRGGMGVVFRARQISLNREVAVKMILRGRLASELDLQRFLAEAGATARLEHLNIVPVYDVGDVDGRPFFSMQYVRGETLASRLVDGPLPQRDAAQIVASVARAIDFAHRQGVLHRDLKPSNILLARDGTPMVTDFGLAKQTSDAENLTHSGMLVGTPAYMSPEQAGGQRGQVGPASDVYSLGCVLYHALTGRPPFVADSTMQLMFKVMEHDPSPPRALRPTLDRDLEVICVRCLQKPADLRYATAGQLADDLEAFLRDERILARSGRLTQVIARLFRETHHAVVLENWGLLWMWHSLALFVACSLTWLMESVGVTSRPAYAALWVVGLGAWASVFWILRRRMGPVTFVERQVAHVWGASMLGVALLFPLEWWLNLPVLSLSPLLGVIAAMVFMIKAAMFNGTFYFQAAALLLTAVWMAIDPPNAHLIFGVIAALCFFIPGLKYHRRRMRSEPRER
ncbi:MAG: serine/threonine-protein kinase [Pirellulaceae bacterium]